jgi:hypothetical protein
MAGVLLGLLSGGVLVGWQRWDFPNPWETLPAVVLLLCLLSLLGLPLMARWRVSTRPPTESAEVRRWSRIALVAMLLAVGLFLIRDASSRAGELHLRPKIAALTADVRRAETGGNLAEIRSLKERLAEVERESGRADTRDMVASGINGFALLLGVFGLLKRNRALELERSEERRGR